MNGKNIVKNIAIGFALVLAGAGAVLFYKNNIAMNPGETLLKYMSYAEDGEYDKMYDLLDKDRHDLCRSGRTAFCKYICDRIVFDRPDNQQQEYQF